MPKAPKRRFTAQRATITNSLRSLMVRMGATNLRVTHEEIGGVGVEIVFDRDGTRYTVRCEKYAHPDDNFRAAQLTIDHLYRAYETYGVTRDEVRDLPFTRQQEGQRRERASFARVFLPFAAAPDHPTLALPDGRHRPWWEVLGMERAGATKQSIRDAYHALARVHHPEAGGSEEAMRRLNEAYMAASKDVA